MKPIQLKRLRNKLGLTQQQMALELGYTDGRMVRRLENGEISINKKIQIIIKLKYNSLLS